MNAPGTEWAYVAFKFGKYGPRVDPRGSHILWSDKPWDCLGAEYQEYAPRGWNLLLRSFNREATVSAPVPGCRVLLRDWEPGK